MTHNALSRSMGTVPMWLVQAVLGVLLTSLVAWTTWSTATTQKHETRIAVAEQKVDSINKSLDEIKDTQKEQRQDTKDILKMLKRR